MNGKLSKLVSTGRYAEALSLFSNLHFQSHPINEFTFPFLLKACAKLKAFPHGQTLHAHLTKTGYNSDIYAATALTDMYMKLQSLHSALKVFDEIPQPSTTLINVLVSGFFQNGCHKESFEAFKRVSEYGIRPDSATVSSLLSCCHNAVKNGIQIHCWAVKIGVETDIYVVTSLITMYSNYKDPVTASIIFERIRYRDVTCYNAFITGLLHNHIHKPIFELFKGMLGRSRPSPNTVTFLSILSACSDLKYIKFGAQVHVLLVKLNKLLDTLIGTSLLDMYSKCGSWHWAYDIFNELHDVRTLITWNSMISGLMINSQTEDAIKLFEMLQSKGLKPDSATWNCMIRGFSQLGKPDESFLFFRKMLLTGQPSPPGVKQLTSLLSVCGLISAFMTGKEVHGYIIRNKIDHDDFIVTALIDMYMKCGRSLWARLVFDRFKVKPSDPVTWNAMISGYGRNGEVESAFGMFEWMKRENIQPNLSTFNCVLSLCGHTGQVEKGLEFFRSMGSYGLVPSSEHWACVVDMLGRSGRVDEAREVLLGVSEALGSGFASLLGASRFYLDSKLGEEMGRLLVELEPENAMPFVILSNVYAAQERWNEVEKLREEMDRRKLKKIRGFSSVNE